MKRLRQEQDEGKCCCLCESLVVMYNSRLSKCKFLCRSCFIRNWILLLSPKKATFEIILGDIVTGVVVSPAGWPSQLWAVSLTHYETH